MSGRGPSQFYSLSGSAENVCFRGKNGHRNSTSSSLLLTLSRHGSPNLGARPEARAVALRDLGLLSRAAAGLPASRMCSERILPVVAVAVFRKFARAPK